MINTECDWSYLDHVQHTKPYIAEPMNDCLYLLVIALHPMFALNNGPNNVCTGSAVCSTYFFVVQRLMFTHAQACKQLSSPEDNERNSHYSFHRGPTKKLVTFRRQWCCEYNFINWNCAHPKTHKHATIQYICEDNINHTPRTFYDKVNNKTSANNTFYSNKTFLIVWSWIWQLNLCLVN